MEEKTATILVVDDDKDIVAAISKLLDGLNYGYDVIHKILNTDYGYMKSSAQQKFLRSEFRNLPSASVDGLISAVERGEIYKLIIACDVTLDM